jgi:tetratricopeptide (TPR) repeat protein/predicted Ser/Thr protein kinase
VDRSVSDEQHTRQLEDSPTAGDSGALPEVPGIVLGSKLSRYIVLERLGEGGMGVVYAAYDPEFDRKLALKVLWPGSNNQARLVREARAMARLSHPNAVQIYDVGTHEGRVFFAMELVEGTTLVQWLQRRPRSWREIIEVFVQAARGLQAAHEAGLVHRDFKPANVMCSDDGRVLVADFGVAWAAKQPPTELPEGSDEIAIPKSLSATGRGVLIGTPRYMAPEQHSGSSRVDARADQYAFCVSLYEALWGAPPFPQSRYEELAMAKLTGHVPTPPRSPRLPRSIWSAIQRGLAVRPEARWPDLAALVEAIVRRSKISTGAKVVTAATLAGVAAILLLPDGKAACLVSAEFPWTDESRKEIHDRFTAAALPYANDTLTTIDHRLDELATAWQSERTTACASPGLAARPTLRCLDRQRASADAMLVLLRAADADVIEHAGAAVLALPDPIACREPESIADAALDADALELRTRLAAAESIGLLGHATQARADAQSVLARARALGDDRLVAEAELAIGRNAHRLGDEREAIAAMQRAAWTAESAGDDRTSVAAAIELVGMTAAGSSADDDPLLWARHAEAALARLPDAPIDRALLDQHIGTAWEHRADYDAADAKYREALTLLEPIAPPPLLALAGVHTSLGNVAFHKGSYAAAKAEHELAQRLWERALGPEHPQVADAINGLGLDAHMTGDLDRSAALFERALEIRERALGPDHPDVASSLTNLAGVNLARKRLPEARAQFGRALAIKQRTLGENHPLLVATLSNLGAVEMAEGNYDEARRLFARAAAIVEAERGPDHPDLAVILNNVGVALARSGDDAGALAAYQRVYELEVRVLGADHPQLAATHHNIATTLLKLGRRDEAETQYRRALALFEASEGPQGPNTLRTQKALRELGE